MAIGIVAPKQKPGILETVSQGLGVAGQVLGIANVVNEIGYRNKTAERADKDQAFQDQARAKALTEETALKKSDSPETVAKIAEYENAGIRVPKGITGYQAVQQFGPVAALNVDKYKTDQEIRKEAEKLKAERSLNPKNKDADMLPIEDREIVTGLGRKNADKIAIANQIDSVLARANEKDDDGNYKLDKPARLQQFRQLIKTLNSSEGKDAVGAEEAHRLASKLEVGYGGLLSGNTGQFGRDIEGFSEDSAITAQALRSAIKANNNQVADTYAKVGIRRPREDMTIPVGANGKAPKDQPIFAGKSPADMADASEELARRGIKKAVATKTGSR